MLLQNAGSVCHLSTQYRISLRSSPIICAADTILCVGKLIWLCTTSGSPTTTLRHVWYDRFEDGDIEAGSVIDNMWRLNMVAFVLGALPQAVKIFGMKGVPGTQTLASIFLATFLVQEIMRVTAGKPHAIELSSTNITRNVAQRFVRFERIVAITACVIQAACWVWAISNILPSHWFITISEWTKKRRLSVLCELIWIFLVVFSFVASHALAFFIFLYCTDRFPGLLRICEKALKALENFIDVIADLLSGVIAIERDNARKTCVILLGFLLFGVAWCYMFTIVPMLMPHNPSEVSVERIANVVKLVVSAISLSSFAFISHVLYRVFFMGKFSKRLRKLFGLGGSISEFLSLAFLILNFCALFIYYSSIYSSEDTYKPAWTDILG